MLTSHEIFGFMSPPLAARILEHAHDHNRDLYRAALTAVAAALGVRRHAVTLIAGASSRTKIVEVEGADSGALNRLLANAGHGDPT